MNPNREVTCYILLDGFKESYLKDTPFLNLIKKKGFFSKLMESFGFQSYRSAVFAGIEPEDSNISHIWYLSKKKNFYKFFYPFSLIEKTIFNKSLRKLIFYLLVGLSKIFGKNHLSLYAPLNIPFSLIQYFDISEKKMVFDKSYLKQEDLFKLLKRHNKDYLYLGYPIKVFGLNDNLKLIDIRLKEKKYDFIFLHINISDVYGHIYGPNSDKLSLMHFKEDFFVENVYKRLKLDYPIVNFVVSSDHGMVE